MRRFGKKTLPRIGRALKLRYFLMASHSHIQGCIPCAGRRWGGAVIVAGRIFAEGFGGRAGGLSRHRAKSGRKSAGPPGCLGMPGGRSLLPGAIPAMVSGKSKIPPRRVRIPVTHGKRPPMIGKIILRIRERLRLFLKVILRIGNIPERRDIIGQMFPFPLMRTDGTIVSFLREIFRKSVGVWKVLSAIIRYNSGIPPRVAGTLIYLGGMMRCGGGIEKMLAMLGRLAFIVRRYISMAFPLLFRYFSRNPRMGRRLPRFQQFIIQNPTIHHLIPSHG